MHINLLRPKAVRPKMTEHQYWYQLRLWLHTRAMVDYAYIVRATGY